MRVVSREDILKPFLSEKGEMIYELIGNPAQSGGTTLHSVAHVVIPPGKMSSAHYHKQAEETYYILSGKAHMILGKDEFSLVPGQACLIMPTEVHQIINDEGTDLEFIAISAPAWTAQDMNYE